MAKIQLVIEIEERLYKNIIDNDKDDEEFEAMDMAFCDAKPLPKGHGRLIDADKLNIHDVSPADGFVVMGETEEDIDLAPTIIEADKEDSNG